MAEEHRLHQERTEHNCDGNVELLLAILFAAVFAMVPLAVERLEQAEEPPFALISLLLHPRSHILTPYLRKSVDYHL